VNSLPALPRDASDRNRTSPFAFTGNKFEFRAVGSSQSCARPIMILNSIVADSLNYIADELAKEIKPDRKLEDAVSAVVARVCKVHKRVVFGGNGYSEEWKREATEKRGLWHLRTLPEAVAQMASEKNTALFEKLGVLSKTELLVEQHTMYEIYSKSMAIEADCMLAMVQSGIVPVALEFKSKLAASVDLKEPAQEKYLSGFNKAITSLLDSVEKLKESRRHSKKFGEEQFFEQCVFFRSEVTESMANLRGVVDSLENIVDDRLWPFPKYSEMLFLK